MRYIESPENPVDLKTISLFLAGGITGCPDWQQQMRLLLRGTNLCLLNPRRENFPINDPSASYKQIKWEWIKFKESKLILFWFARGSVNPIVLFEYGRWIAKYKKIFVGCGRKGRIQHRIFLWRPGW